MTDYIDIPGLMNEAWEAFTVYGKLSFTERAGLMKAVAAGLEAARTDLVKVYMQDSHLPEARANGELSRTIFQLNSYADAAVRGDWLQASIDTADDSRVPAKPDLRKTLVPLGPVLVFGASNFPFAYSTAGGDTASAWAAGCPVVVKAHPAHQATSVLVAAVIEKAVIAGGFPKGVFTHIVTDDMVAVNELILHPYVKAIGFTGSFTGGKAIWELVHTRKEPVPMFAEMSSINPVYIFPEKLKTDAIQVANSLAGSITLGAGQFCTNPGLLVVTDGPGFNAFTLALADAIRQTAPVNMLHEGIAASFRANREHVLQQEAVSLLAETGIAALPLQDIPTIAQTTATAFIENEVLASEVFGSFSLMVVCKNTDELLAVAKHMHGQLTASVMITEGEACTYKNILAEIERHCGRFIYNQVPTGVEVCQAQQHGGPWPSTTDSRFSSVGADAIRRFARPVSYQNWPDALLPAALQNANPLGINRTVNNTLTDAGL